MPSATQVHTISSSKIRKFELPVLAPLDSLTEGTNIPPPIYSPVEQTAPLSFPTEVEPENEPSATVNGHANGVNGVNGVNGTNGINGSHSEKAHSNGSESPVSSSGPGSIRRFLSRRSMNSLYRSSNRSSKEDPTGGMRPESALSMASGMGDSKRSSWFRKFMNGGSRNGQKAYKRTSTVFEEKVSQGPPPPTLPELSQLEAKVIDDEGSLGAEDMFKNIR